MPTKGAGPALTMEAALRSDVGRRENNEDAAFATSRLIAIADGVGGATAGEVASQAVIQEMASLDKRRLAERLDDELRSAVSAANAKLGFLISCRPELTGMATTLTAVALSNDGSYLIASVGDSRAYLFRKGRLRRLTRDESLVQALVESGAITPEQAWHHPQRSVVLRALDGISQHELELTSEQAAAGDRLLVCSDGLSDVLPDQEIADALEEPSRARAADALIERALRAGGADNISVVVADVTRAREQDMGWLEVRSA